MRMSPDLPFNFTSNSLSNKITYARGGNNISTLNSVVNSTFLTLPLEMTVSGTVPTLQGGTETTTYNADITFSYKLTQ